MSRCFQAHEKNSTMVSTDIDADSVRIRPAQSPKCGISRWFAMPFGRKQQTLAAFSV